MDKAIRNTLRNTVTQCRKLLEDSISELLQGQFGIHKDGKIEDESHMGHLSDEDRDYREKIIIHLEHIAGGDKVTQKKNAEALSQLVREAAFTHLNRLCAYKMLEVRKLIRESVSRGINSNNFKFYLADYPEEEKFWSTGKQDIAYRHFLVWLGRTLTDEIGVLFSPFDPANRLFPHYRVLEEILELINNNELSDIWQEDETIGWIYQYFTPKELRDKVRKESSAPRNSYELAFRNQFYTPRYVVQFLVDNTLGRIWYEMNRGETKLNELCQYFVKRPKEIFLSPGEEIPHVDSEKEPSLNDPVYIPHREKKDPRDIKILDPACGSGHFLLYCFDLLEIIYREAYKDETFPPFTETGNVLTEDYPDEETFNHSIPGLILRYNLHGIDIDLRATQIASLALWLRVQKSYQELNLKKNERPKITKSNIVCAEPMPGEKELLDEFVFELKPTVLGQLVRVIFDKMTLAGEAGSLLKIEEEIREAVGEARKQWLSQPKTEQLELFQIVKDSRDRVVFTQLEFDLSDITDETFWNDTELKVIEFLQEYAEKASNGKGYLRKLFSEDAAEGFSFIDILRKKFDVILMNPPYGDRPKNADSYLRRRFGEHAFDLYCSFVIRGLHMMTNHGYLGALTSRTFMTLATLEMLRKEILSNTSFGIFWDLGHGVLDTAVVETCAFLLRKDLKVSENGHYLFTNVELENVNKIYNNLNILSKRLIYTIEGFQFAYRAPKALLEAYVLAPKRIRDMSTSKMGLATGYDERFIRLIWEIKSSEICYPGWVFFSKGGEFSRFYSSIHLLVNWCDEGKSIAEYSGARVQGKSLYFKKGITWPWLNKGFNPRFLPENCIFANISPLLELKSTDMELNFGILGYLSSTLVSYFLDLITPSRNYTVEQINNIPLPDDSMLRMLAPSTEKCFMVKRIFDIYNETSSIFIHPFTKNHTENGVYNLKDLCNLFCEYIHNTIEIINHSRLEIEEIINQKFIQLDIDPYKYLCDEVLSVDLIQGREEETKELFIMNFISYMFGCILGRWDIRFSLNSSLAPKLPGPFDHLPVCPPGLLINIDGLPAKKDNIVSEEWLKSRPDAITLPHDGSVKNPVITEKEYPLKIDWDGILVDDENHSDDIIRRIREVLYLLWKDTSDDIEQEACQILGVKNLREYFRKPKGGFFDDHIKRYSKSRRKAPIYWLLQSSKKNYGLWIYYHRLDRDILFKALENYVRPKLNHEENRLMELRNQKAGFESGSKEVRMIEKEIDKEEAFISELVDFKEKLERAAKLYLDPDLNDGVVLNIAPLWELVPWGEAKKYWNELMEGKYEWSSIGKQLREKGIVRK